MSLPKPMAYLLRLSITLGAIALAFSQVPLHEVTPLLRTMAWPAIVFALLLTHAGQVLSALRTRYYLQCHGIALPLMPSVKLHYVGGLFNAFLPGGAGGDAYKAWWLKRHRKGKLLNMVGIMVAGRLNGLWVLGLILCALAALSGPVGQALPHAPYWMAAAAVAGTAGYSVIARYMLREPLARQWRAAIYSFGLQLMLALSAYGLCLGLGLGADGYSYVMLFMFSCMAAMLPISIGGIGVRELALLHGSRLLGLSQSQGVTLAFSFTLIALSVPLVGAVVHHFFAPEHDR